MLYLQILVNFTIQKENSNFSIIDKLLFTKLYKHTSLKNRTISTLSSPHCRPHIVVPTLSSPHCRQLSVTVYDLTIHSIQCKCLYIVLDEQTHLFLTSCVIV